MSEALSVSVSEDLSFLKWVREFLCVLEALLFFVAMSLMISLLARSLALEGGLVQAHFPALFESSRLFRFFGLKDVGRWAGSRRWEMS